MKWEVTLFNGIHFFFITSAREDFSRQCHLPKLIAFVHSKIHLTTPSLFISTVDILIKFLSSFTSISNILRSKLVYLPP